MEKPKRHDTKPGLGGGELVGSGLRRKVEAPFRRPEAGHDGAPFSSEGVEDRGPAQQTRRISTFRARRTRVPICVDHVGDAAVEIAWKHREKQGAGNREQGIETEEESSDPEEPSKIHL